MEQRPYRMRAVEAGMGIISPMGRITIGDVRPEGLTIMDILPFSVAEFAKFALKIETSHLHIHRHVTKIF